MAGHSCGTPQALSTRRTLATSGYLDAHSRAPVRQTLSGLALKKAFEFANASIAQYLHAVRKRVVEMRERSVGSQQSPLDRECIDVL